MLGYPILRCWPMEGPFLSCTVFKHLNTRKCEIHWANVLGTWWVKVETHGDPSLVIFIHSACLFAVPNLDKHWWRNIEAKWSKLIGSSCLTLPVLLWFIILWIPLRSAVMPWIHESIGVFPQFVLFADRIAGKFPEILMMPKHPEFAGCMSSHTNIISLRNIPERDRNPLWSLGIFRLQNGWFYDILCDFSINTWNILKWSSSSRKSCNPRYCRGRRARFRWHPRALPSNSRGVWHHHLPYSSQRRRGRRVNREGSWNDVIPLERAG